MKSDVEELMPRLLPVDCGENTEEVDLSGPPRNPQEYLRQVQLEASLCPDVVVAQIDPKKLKKKQTVNVSVTGCLAAPVGFSPSLSWQQRQVSRFSDVRQSITKNRTHWSNHTLDDNVRLPKLTDEEGWKRFCLGEKTYPDPSASGLTDEDQEPALDYSKVVNPLPCLLDTGFLCSLEKPGRSILEGRWLYALLACLEKPLLPEAHSSIRQLARRCAQVRSTMNSQWDDNLPALNLLICLVAR
uniref:Gem-associated protein 2 n=1 Tax=Fundulus heteroclitus TaxID=8078 RepID=A0A3Q2QZM8_FUNHE